MVYSSLMEVMNMSREDIVEGSKRYCITTEQVGRNVILESVSGTL